MMAGWDVYVMEECTIFTHAVHVLIIVLIHTCMREQVLRACSSVVELLW